MPITDTALLRNPVCLAALLLAASCQGRPTPAGVARATHADALRWERLESGVQLAVLYGDRTRAEPFGLRLRYPPGYRKGPHHHPHDAFVTVLSGSYYRGYGDAFDASRGIHLVAGTFSINPAGVAHYEWVEEPAELEVHATGPWGSVYVDAGGHAMSAAHQEAAGDACGGACSVAMAAPAVSSAERAPTVLRPEALEWKPRDGGDEVAVLFGDPAQPGPFVLRIRSTSASRERPHHHPRDAFITVLSGGFHFGTGDEFDPAAADAVASLDTLALPAGSSHFKWNDDASVVEVHASGPWSTTWLEE